jgi:metal-responsive CopG/Arc/MetJ family transcriptional regulator
MGKEKIAISLDKEFVSELDRLVDARIFSNRSQAIQQAVSEKIMRLKHNRLAVACRKLEPQKEQEMAEEGIAEDLKDWPEY